MCGERESHRKHGGGGVSRGGRPFLRRQEQRSGEVFAASGSAQAVGLTL